MQSFFLWGLAVQKQENLFINRSFDASSAYAVERISSEYQDDFRKLGLQVYVGYLFHHKPFKQIILASRSSSG